MLLKNKITRCIAFLTSCIIVAFCVFRVVEVVNEANSTYSREDIYVKHGDVVYEMEQMYGKLWAVGVMYLRNLDEDGNFTGSEEMKEQTIKALQKLGCMNAKGEIEIENEKGFKYKVAYGERSIGNDDLIYDHGNEYLMGKRNDQMFHSSFVNNYAYTIYDFNWYQTNYGMTYYEMPNKSFAIYDYDTTGMYSVKDNRGATLYFRLDGSTPIPESYLEQSDEISYEPYIGNSINGTVNIDNIINTSAVTSTAVSSETTAESASGTDLTDTTAVHQRETTGAAIITETIDQYNDYDNNYDNYDESELESVDLPNGKSGLYYYNVDNGYLYRVNVQDNQFIKELGDEFQLEILIQPNDQTISDYNRIEQVIKDTEKACTQAVIRLIPFAAIALILMLYVLITGGYSVKEKKTVMTWCDKIFAELPIAILIIAFMCICAILYGGMYYEISEFCKEYYSEGTVPKIYALICGCIFGVGVLMIDTIVVRLKCRSFWKTTLIYKILAEVYHIIKKIRMKMAEHTIRRDMLKNDRFIVNFLIRTAVFAAVEVFWIFVGLCFNSFFVIFFMSIIAFTGYIIVSLLDLKAMTDITKHVSDMNGGNYSKQTVSKLSPAYVCNEKLNNISAGIQTAVDKQIRSERMKIDLVTNVSHDLKTPLTSIISYIDLLSAEELTPEAKDYVKIIAEKSERLKSMVADLFDLAKATSRTDINAEAIDAVILTGQVLGDLADKIEKSGREIRTDIKIESAPIMAEGKKLYRVFQNLIDNALKYSMAGTRIYVVVRKEWNKCVIIVKNIASYEMNFTPDEITERFTRGDESRSTEGNGLGLSIAKNFTEACGGTFRIIIDGDVFTAEMSFPLINNAPKTPNEPLTEEKK